MNIKLKPKINAAIEFLKKMKGECPMTALNQAKGVFKLSSADVKTLLENY